MIIALTHPQSKTFSSKKGFSASRFEGHVLAKHTIKFEWLTDLQFNSTIIQKYKVKMDFLWYFHVLLFKRKLFGSYGLLTFTKVRMKHQLMALSILLLHFAVNFESHSQTNSLKNDLVQDEYVNLQVGLRNAIQFDTVDNVRLIYDSLLVIHPIQRLQVSFQSTNQMLIEDKFDFSSKLKFLQAHAPSKVKLKDPIFEAWSANQIGIGSLYKFGQFSGTAENVFSDYTIIKPLFIYWIVGSVYFDIGFSFFGAIGEMNQANFTANLYLSGVSTPAGIPGILDRYSQMVIGEYYGKCWEFYLSGGIRVVNTKYVSTIPVVSLNRLAYNIYATKTVPLYKPAKHHQEISEFRSDMVGMGPGVVSLIHLWKNDPGDTKISILVRYNAFFLMRESQFDLDGMMHEFSAGLLLIGLY